MREEVVIGVDVGGSHISAAKVTAKGKLLEPHLKIDLKEDKSYLWVKQKLKELIDSLLTEEVIGIGIGLPGRVDVEKGICYFSPNFPHWKEVPIRDDLVREIALPIYVINDVNAMALGEKTFGAGKGVSNLVCFTIGTGIGGGIIIDNKLLTGANFGAGEIGHITVEPGGPLCGCGNRGCWETLASGTAIVRWAKEYILKNPGKSKLERLNPVTPKTIAMLALAGDEGALWVYETVGKYLGIGIANLITILDPQLIVIGGEIVKSWNLFIKSLLDSVKERLFMVPFTDRIIVKASLAEFAGIIGSCVFAFKELGKL